MWDDQLSIIKYLTQTGKHPSCGSRLFEGVESISTSIMIFSCKY